MTTTDDIKPAVRAFMAQFFSERDIADDTDIFAAGLVNSLFVMQLVLFVESEFGLTVEDEDLEMDNFHSVDAIEAFVARKRAVAVGS